MPGMNMNGGMQQTGMSETNMTGGMQQNNSSWKCQCGAENTGKVFVNTVVSQDRFKQWETEWTGLFTLFVIKTLKIDDSSENYMIKWYFIVQLLQK